MDALIGLTGILGFIISIVWLIVNIIKKKPKKRPGIVIGISFALFIIGVSMSPGNTSNTASTSNTKTEQTTKKEETTVITASDKELLKKSYAAFDEKQRTQFAEIEEKYKKLPDNDKQPIKSDFERLSKERDVQVAKWAEEDAKKAKEKELAEANKYETGITYDQLARTPGNFKGKNVKFTGKVIQVIEGDNETDLRIAVNDNYDTVLLVAYNPKITSTRVLENDNVTIKGVSKGLQTYQSTIGGNITIPLVLVDIITINKAGN